MHRLFVGIRPPSAMREALLAMQGEVAGARWQDGEQLHITLRFIGEVDRHRAEDVAAALGGVHHPAFQVAVAGLGSFDRKGRVDSIWAGLKPHDHLRALAAKVDGALARVGVPRETRAFLPHVTLARLPRGAGPLQAYLSSAAGATSPAFTIGSFALYESELTPSGSIYTIAERYPLG
jgi:RNA 2',3'-cyclic 3'-phosphodiesterase